MTQILADGQPFYTFSREDRLWLARMLIGESSDPRDWEAQLWALTQRFVLRRKRYERTMTELAQEFSQPINPDWYRDGAYCLPGGRFHDDPGCGEDRMQRRDDLREDHWTPRQLRAELEAVDRFLAGRTPNPVPGATDWHATRLAAGNVRYAPHLSNVFQGPPGFTTEVTLAPGGVPAWVGPALGAAGAVALVGAGVLWWRRTRR
ncbi:MAG: hypothetical protein IPK85_01565 [Gemmatimonadetes bacterium]|nr:hypothetical protein [Gemmatimonadota bacterium]